MAKFASIQGAAISGWRDRVGSMQISVGENRKIALIDGGGLTVKSLNSSVCVLHEEPRVLSQPGSRKFLVTCLQSGQAKVVGIHPITGAVEAELTVSSTGISAPKLVFFPGEREERRQILGAIYVVGGHGEQIKAAGGPFELSKKPNQGGHVAEPTPPGTYTLGPQIHVTSSGWPYSVIPWGAALRIGASKEVEYEVKAGKWLKATGATGAVTRAQTAFELRSGIVRPVGNVIASVRSMFISQDSEQLLFNVWELNDFGRWGWNLRKGGKPTPYYIHTTPIDELNSSMGRSVLLANSHGCIHVIPEERDRLMNAGYLKEGVILEVRPYNEIGPPQ